MARYRTANLLATLTLFAIARKRAYEYECECGGAALHRREYCRR